LHPIEEKDTGVIMTTIKLNALLGTENVGLSPVVEAEGKNGLPYLAFVDRALAGAQMRSGTISAGYSHVIPSHPMAKNVLKMNKKAATMPGVVPPIFVMAARMIMDADMPAAPNSMSFSYSSSLSS
jgi:hypothetical protein